MSGDGKQGEGLKDELEAKRITRWACPRCKAWASGEIDKVCKDCKKAGLEPET